MTLINDIEEFIKANYPTYEIRATDVGMEKGKKFVIVEIIEKEPIADIVRKIQRRISVARK